MIQLFSWEIANALKKEYVVIFNWGLEMRPRGPIIQSSTKNLKIEYVIISIIGRGSRNYPKILRNPLETPEMPLRLSGIYCYPLKRH